MADFDSIEPVSRSNCTLAVEKIEHSPQKNKNTALPSLPIARFPHLTYISIKDDSPSVISHPITHINYPTTARTEFAALQTMSNNVGRIVDIITGIIALHVVEDSRLQTKSLSIKEKSLTSSITFNYANHPSS
ncbi:hypothetical protein AX16_006057 [Volvariella volvacea WC 439]|nr:hypothetical protein AX16_006057 [Volvariella volvacea WC 439]